MKNILVLSILFYLIAMPALAELTAEDFEKIRQIIKDSETELKADIEKTSSTLKADIEKTSSTLKAEIDKTNSKLDAIDARLRTVETGVAELRGRNIGFSVVKDWLVAVCAVVAICISIIALRKTQSADIPTPQDPQKALP